jgi:hypothetical protein
LFNGKRETPLICFDGSKDKPYMEITEINQGLFFRKDNGQDDSFLFLGDIKKVFILKNLTHRPM